MQSGAIQQLKNNSDALSQRPPDEDIMKLLGYARRENFQTAISRAVESCNTTGYAADDHFRGAAKMVKLGSSAERDIDGFMPTHNPTTESHPACHIRHTFLLTIGDGSLKKTIKIGRSQQSKRVLFPALGTEAEGDHLLTA